MAARSAATCACTPAIGSFEEPVRWWEGTLQARWSAALRERLGPHAPIFETVPVHPGTAAVALPWQSAAAHRSLMERSANLSLVAVLAAAGAAEVFSLHRRRFAFRPGSPAAHRAWAEATRQAGFAGGRATLASYHQMGSPMGSRRIGTDPATRVAGAAPVEAVRPCPPSS